MTRTPPPSSLQASFQPLRESHGGGSAALDVQVVDLPALAVLEGEWRDLESRSDASFFITWDWIGAWLAALPPDVRRRLVRVRIAGRTVGLAVFCEGERHRGPITTRSLYLHATGRPELDELTVEYNGILADRIVEGEVVRAVLARLLEDPAWEEVHFDGWHRADLVPALERPGLRLVAELRRPNRYVDLAALRLSARPYVDQLPSSRIRNHIRRTFRGCEAMGGTSFRVAATVEEALAFFADLKRLNLQAWSARPGRSAFANEFFCRFHEGLVRAGLPRGTVQVGQLSAGGRPVGYVYSFLHRGRVYAYQTGFDYGAGDFSVWSPGLATHACGIEHNRQLGFNVYDLMAGDCRYKKDLAQHTAEMSWLVVQRPGFKLQLYGGLRAAWSQVQGWARGGEVPLN